MPGQCAIIWFLCCCCLVAKSCPTLCNLMDCSMPGFPAHHQLLELAQTYVHQISDAIQLSHPLSSPSPPAFNLSQHHGLFKWVSSSHQVAEVLELQLQHQYFQWTFRVDFIQDWLVWFLVYFRGPRDKCFSLGSPKPTISATLLFQKNQKYVITNEIFIIL